MVIFTSTLLQFFDVGKRTFIRAIIAYGTSGSIAKPSQCIPAICVEGITVTRCTANSPVLLTEADEFAANNLFR